MAKPCRKQHSLSMKSKNLNFPPALVLIDIQKGFDEDFWGVRNNPNAEKRMIEILDFFRKNKMPIIHIKHNSLNPKSPLHPKSLGNDLKDFAQPLKNELLLEKSVNCAFWGSDLKNVLDKKDIKNIVLCGLTTDHCVSTTARSGANLGFNVTVLSDATATFDRDGIIGTFIIPYPAGVVHELALASLNKEFAKILTTEQLIGKLNRKNTQTGLTSNPPIGKLLLPKHSPGGF